MNWTRSEVARLLRERGITLRRSLGQNYLVDPNFLDALARDAEVGPGDSVVEIGSGLGNLTERLAARAGRVIAIEIDEAVHALSKELVGGLPNVTLVQGDGAGFARHATGRVKVVSNLPYGDWGRLLVAVLAAPLDIESCTLMVQSDVYERLRAPAGTREYGPMAALVQSTCSLKKLRKAGKEMFLPVPKVESTVFRLLRPRPVPDAADLEATMRSMFAQRRKKSAAAGGRRAEALAPAELLALAREALGRGEHSSNTREV